MNQKIEENSEPSQKESAAETKSCRWCDSMLNSAAIESVCPSCRKLLITANLPEEEVFGKENKFD